MTRSERMQPVVQVAETREREAAKALGACQQQLHAHQNRLAQLQGYRMEYLERFQAAGQGGMSGAQLREWQQFLANLDQAIDQQRRQVELTGRQCDQVRLAWLRVRSKQKAVEKVVDRFRTEEIHAAAKREQKDNDEIAQRKGRPRDDDE
jgi:flagellar FliJ protein